MITQRRNADIKSLSVIRLPRMNVRIHAVEHSEARKILYAKHIGSATLIGHNEHVWLKARDTYQIMPAIHGGMLKVVPGHSIPAAGRKGVAEKRTAYPQKPLHAPPATVM